MIKWDKVITVDQKQLEKEQQLRAQRDRAIADTDWLVTRHRDELDMMKVAAVLPDEAEPITTLSDSEYVELLRYRQALRDWSMSMKELSNLLALHQECHTKDLPHTLCLSLTKHPCRDGFPALI